MRTGKLRSRVTVVGYTLVSDGAGGTTPTRTEILDTWAKVQPIKGQRLLQYNQIVEGRWYSIQMRFREDTPIVKDYTIEYNGRPLVVHSVINTDERNRVIEIAGYEKA
jgi:SPP1 family predicted phage head-tail adaptor